VVFIDGELAMAGGRYESRNLGHLGLVAGIFDELGLGRVIN